MHTHTRTYARAHAHTHTHTHTHTHLYTNTPCAYTLTKRILKDLARYYGPTDHDRQYTHTHPLALGFTYQFLPIDLSMVKYVHIIMCVHTYTPLSYKDRIQIRRLYKYS